MTREETSGGSCGVPPAPGKGRSTMRGAACAIPSATLRDGMTQVLARAGAGRRRALRQAADVLGGATIEERQRNFENKASEIRGLARNIAARSNQLGKSTASEMRALADFRRRARRANPASPATIRRLPSDCAQAAAQAEQPAELKLREAVFNEGPGRRRQCRQKPLEQHRRLYGELRSVTYVSGGKVITAGHTDSRRADHRPRRDRAARDDRHRYGPAGAGDRQSAARAAVRPAFRRARRGKSTMPSNGDQSRAGRRSRMGAPALHPSQQGVVSRDPESLQLRSRE